MCINTSGLPHSEIPGSKPVCGSPELIAAYHVLHRHLAPRHSPYALSSLTIDMRTKTVLPDSFCVLSSGLNPSFGTLRVRLRLAASAGQVFCGRKKLPFAGYSIVKDLLLSGGKIPRKSSEPRDFSPGPPGSLRSRGPRRPAPLVRQNFLSYHLTAARNPSRGMRGEAGQGAPAEREAGGLTKPNKVENTGLEPVTSWLQTRRSPS